MSENPVPDPPTSKQVRDARRHAHTTQKNSTPAEGGDKKGRKGKGDKKGRRGKETPKP